MGWGGVVGVGVLEEWCQGEGKEDCTYCSLECTHVEIDTFHFWSALQEVNIG